MPTLIQEKVRQAVGILRELDVDCWLTFTRESELNGDPLLPFLVDGAVTWHSAFIVSSSGRTVAIVGAYDKKAVEDTGAYDEVIGYVEGIKSALLATLRSLAPRAIAINYSEGSEVCDGLTHGMYLTLSAFLTEIGFQDRLTSAEKVISALRERKTPSEIASMREAIRATEEIFRKVAGFIRVGLAESEIAAFMQAEVAAARLETAWQSKTCPAVFTGPDTAEAHYAPTERLVQEGHVLNIDFGVRVKGYCSDLQRTFYIRAQGEGAAPLEVRRGFDTIVRAIESARRALRPGALGHEIDRVARDALAAAGFEAFLHGLGHQVGRFAHDGTALLGPAWEKYAQKPFAPIERGMVFTLEPRLTVPGRGVVTVEEMVLVTADGADYLSTPQTELWLI
jgi:Xaa-Pro aminopeptidase